MENKGNSYSTLTEKELFELLAHVLSGTSQDHKRKRINGLEEMRRRIKSNSIRNMNGSVDILLEMAKKQGHNQPESSLIVDSLLLFINKHEEAFQTVLSGLKGQEKEEGLLFLVFSKLVLKLDYKRKRQAIRPLVRFLVSGDVVNRIGVKEVCDCLFSLGNEKLGTEIVKEASPYLASLEMCTILFSVKLCSKFADNRLLPKMLEVLEKSMKGYFDGFNTDIERDICHFLERVKDLQGLPHLIELLKIRYDQGFSHISNAIKSILEVHPYRTADILDLLYDARDEKLVDAILYSFEEMEKTIDARKLLSKIRINWWYRHPSNTYVHNILVKGGKSSKPILFEILKDEEKYDFALRCLKEIGVSNEELSKLFPKPPMLQIYDFFYRGRKKFPKGLDNLWKEKEKLGKQMPGKITRLDHLIMHIFSCFNFATLVVDPAERAQGADLICFYPENLNLFIIGCTTGILKDDLAKMDALITKMEKQMPSLFDVCSVTPIVVCSEVASISPSDAKYSAQQGIVIMQSRNIDKLLEMLNTDRKPREAIKYIEDCKISQLSALDFGS